MNSSLRRLALLAIILISGLSALATCATLLSTERLHPVLIQQTASAEAYSATQAPVVLPPSQMGSPFFGMCGY